MSEYKSRYLRLVKSVAALNQQTKKLITQMESLQKQYQEIILATIEELPAEVFEEGAAL